LLAFLALEARLDWVPAGFNGRLSVASNFASGLFFGYGLPVGAEDTGQVLGLGLPCEVEALDGFAGEDRDVELLEDFGLACWGSWSDSTFALK
jgi:hypothetical protein